MMDNHIYKVTAPKRKLILLKLILKRVKERQGKKGKLFSEY